MDDSATQAAQSTVDATGSSTGANGVRTGDMYIDWDAIIKEYDDEFDQEVDHIRRLMPRLVGQLIHGCGDSKCRTSQCATGTRNATRAPTRNYSPRSARIVAFALLSRPDPDSYLCEYYEARMQSDSTESGERPESEEGPKDPTSLTQLMADTDCFTRLAKGEPVESLNRAFVDTTSRRVAAITRKLQKYHERPFLADRTMNPRFARNKEVADTLAAALSLFYDILPPDKDQPSDWHSLAYYINHGRATPSQGHQAGSDLPNVDALLRVFESDQNVRLCAEICKVVALRTQVEDVMVKPRRHYIGTGGLLTFVAKHVEQIAHVRIRDKFSKRTGETIPWVPWPYPLWLKKAFLRDWDGSPVIKRGSIACGALELMEMQQWIWERWHQARRTDAMLLPYVFKRMDLTEAMRSWAASPPVTTVSRHLLSFPCLFTPAQILMYFRMQNHLRMREANKQAHLYEDLYERHVANSDAASEAWDARTNEVQHLRDFYLLMTVRRDRIIQDAFDQLWQRRKSELVKPLRVRLGEMEFHEVGQDLGGVQIEFFNLICTAIFAEDNGMFSTDPITGLSTIRPGSLQPLHMFELFGLILALALHNGIPIPVNFPLVFYKQLLSQPYGSLDDLEEAWPTVTRSLRALNEGAHEGLDYEFPLEANGLRISVNDHTIAHLQKQLASQQQQQQQHTSGDHRFTLQTTETTRLDNPTSTIPPTPLSWPGWTLLPPPANPAPPTPLTPQTTPAYARDYALWLTTLSVLPQLHALLRGLHTLLPARTLALHTPATLRATLQGTPHLSLPALRAATLYEHYTPADPYIASFWRVLARWPERDQRALLRFVTAAERIPITGAGALTFKIAGAERAWDSRGEAGDENELLPTSSTCFGTLYLPRYRDEETLEGRLRVAVEFGGVGFGVA